MGHPLAATAAAPRVLLVEPYRGLREILADLLRCEGVTCMAAPDHASAISAASTWRPTVAVVEPHHPRLEGDGHDELITALHAVNPSLPVVVHTAMFAPGTLPRPERFGAVGIVVKGNPPGELLAAIQHAHKLAADRLPARDARVGVAR